VRNKQTARRTGHRLRWHETYGVWAELKQRALNPRNPYYPEHAGQLHQPWIVSFEAFHRDVVDGWRPGLVLTRIDDHDIFRPGNVEWTKPVQRNNKSGVTGVSWNGRENKWAVDIGVDGRNIRVGGFHAFDDAVVARHQAELKYWGEPRPKPRPKQRRTGTVKWNKPNKKWEACLRSRYLGIFADRNEAELAVARAIAAPVRPTMTRERAQTIIRQVKQIVAPPPPLLRRRTLGQLWGVAA